ncbi:hypothetical protein D6C76_05389 [Aureobasidium pullulans]|nr:hypothetical protein D6C76_05389 [Aureobasidium pullulans]
MIGLINAIPATTWGTPTDDCKKFLRIAITGVYELDDRRSRALSQTNPPTNVDREILQWLAVSQFPPGFLDTVGTHRVWKLILCHWAGVCSQRNQVWYFKGFAGRLFNKVWGDVRATNTKDDWATLKLGVSELVNRFNMAAWTASCDDTI